MDKNYIVDARGRRRMVRLLQPEREVTVTQICYNQGMQKNTSESTMRKKT